VKGCVKEVGEGFSLFTEGGVFFIPFYTLFNFSYRYLKDRFSPLTGLVSSVRKSLPLGAAG